MSMFRISTVMLLTWSGAAPAVDSDGRVNAIRTAFEANRGAFTFATIRFRLAIGRATSEEAAANGDLSDKVVADGFYAFDGIRGRYECVFPELEPGKSKRRVRRSIRSLTDGELSLWDDAVSHSQIDAGINEFYDWVNIPISIGKTTSNESLIKLVDAVSKGHRGCQLKSITTGHILDGAEVVLLTFDAPEFQNNYWVDLARGAIPIRSRSSNKKDKITLTHRYSNIKFINEFGWFPYNWSSHYSHGLTSYGTIIEANFTKPPNSSTFRLDFKEPTSLLNTKTMLRYPARKTWDLSSLPPPGAPGVRRTSLASNRKGSGESPMPGERVVPPWWRVLAVISLAVVIISLISIYRIRRRPTNV